ncbi:hypothetical protein BSLG_003337 [Batrachochytrium salamandrivorans]|nr:hypothetical protein BSLG_003337 [Batrachochytrium salamandrivorans]
MLALLICTLHHQKASTGTYSRGEFIHASVLGKKQAGAADGLSSMPTLTVVRNKQAAAGVPEIGNIIIGKVTRINPRFASVSIMVVADTPCTETFQGVIRVQDVRATEKDKVLIYRSFRPGDIIRARIASLGDARSYHLSTAQNELGVVFAQSLAGATMVPISWEEMICPKTRVIEYRKCAKPTASE